MRQSNSTQICTPTGKRRQRSIVVYSLAINDSQGLSSRLFGTEEDVLQRLAESAEGPDETERIELRKLAKKPDTLPFWRFLAQTTAPYVQYRLQCHTITLGGMR
jgi:hypothetical protein